MKTTKDDFVYFRKRCKKWQNFFHLGNWKIEYQHKDMGGENYAQTQSWPVAWKAIIRLNKDWTNSGDRALNKKELDETARHEMLHILISLPEEEAVVRLTNLFA